MNFEMNFKLSIKFYEHNKFGKIKITGWNTINKIDFKESNLGISTVILVSYKLGILST